jgi:hypothetical protein
MGPLLFLVVGLPVAVALGCLVGYLRLRWKRTPKPEPGPVLCPHPDAVAREMEHIRQQRKEEADARISAWAEEQREKRRADAKALAAELRASCALKRYPWLRSLPKPPVHKPTDWLVTVTDILGERHSFMRSELSHTNPWSSAGERSLCWSEIYLKGGFQSRYRSHGVFTVHNEQLSKLETPP